MPLVYNYHHVTGAFVGTQEAMKNPKPDADLPSPSFSGDEFLLPQYATTIEPPSVPEGQMAVFANGEWTLEPYAAYAPAPIVSSLQQVTDNLSTMISNLQSNEPAVQAALTAAQEAMAGADQSNETDYNDKQAALLVAESNMALMTAQVTALQTTLQQKMGGNST